MSPAPGRPTLPRARPRFTIARTLSTPDTCWVTPIDHTRMADRADAYISREAGHVGTRGTRCLFEPVERLVLELGEEPVEPGGVFVDEAPVDPTAREQLLQHAVDECDITAGVDREELVGDLRPEQRALDVRRHPVTLEPGLAQRIHDRDPRAPLLGEIQVLHEHGLGVGHIGAEEHDEVALDHVAIRAGGRGDTDRLLERRGRRRVTDAGRVVDVVRPDEPRGLLRRVIDLVRDPARGEIETDAIGSGGADARRDLVECLIPRDARETRLARAPQHRVRQPSELPQLPAVEPGQRVGVGEMAVVDGGRGVDLQQVEPGRAQVHPADGPVVEPGNAERAAVAHTLAQDARRVRQLPAVVPYRARDRAVVVRLLFADAVGLPPHPLLAPEPDAGLDEIVAAPAAPPPLHRVIRSRRRVRIPCTR